jgi:SulP family sulfate permease
VADSQTKDEVEEEPEVNQPGLSEVREAVATHLERRLPTTASFREDAVAGLNSAVASVPDGMASGILVGVNPIYGLYACMVGPIVGSIFASTRLMLIVTTSAASLSAGQALGDLKGDARDTALFLMVALIGGLQFLFGVLRLGKLTRFVSYSVMTGFIFGIAVLTILSQFPTVSGYEPTAGSNKVTQAWNVLSNLNSLNPWSLAVAGLTAVLAVLLPRTKLGSFGRLVAIIVPSVLVLLMQVGSVKIVSDVGEIPKGIPMPHLPSFSGFSLDVLTGAFAVAVVVLVQGAGVSQSVPNPDGSRRSTSRDFVAQGAANLASGLFRGLPVGGSLSTTALTVLSGSRSRWAAIFAGLWMAVLVIVFPVLVSYVVMPALGVLLIIASLTTIKPREGLAIWYTGWPSRLASITTFLSTLLLPIQAAVAIGVVLSALLYVNESSTDVSVVRLVKEPDGVIKEREAPKRLPDNEVTVLDVYGHLFYAGARTLEQLLPQPADARNPVVVLRLRGRSKLGATLVEVLSTYADRLQEVNGRLYLSGITEKAYGEVVRTGKLRLSGPVRVYEATSSRGQSTNKAVDDARSWLVGKSDDSSPNEEATG